MFRESGPTLAFARRLGKKKGISLTNVRETVDKLLSPFKKPRSAQFKAALPRVADVIGMFE